MGVLTIAGALQAQDDISGQIWLDYNPRIDLEGNLSLYGDIGVRTELEPSGWGRFILRPGLRGLWDRFNWIAGAGLFATFNETESNELELRPFQGLSTWWPSTGLPLNHYVRLEQRLQWKTQTGDLTAQLRFRYRLQIQVLWSGIKGQAHWRILLHGEAFFTLSGEAGQFDEDWRIGIGVERGISPQWRVRVDLTFQKEGLPLSGEPTNDLYLRLRVFHP